MTAPLDTRELRNTLGVFATGVTVVTTADEQGRPRGFTANSFTSVSLDPPLVLVCIARGIGSAPVFLSAEHFAVNILAADQQDVSTAFGTPAGTRFESVAHAPGRVGSPVIDGVAAWIECAVHDLVEQGDHVILVGRVLHHGSTTAAPLGYCRGAYVTFGLAQDALNAAQDRTPLRIGAIVEHEGSVYLEPGDDGWPRLPTAGRLGADDEPDTLIGRLHAAGVRMDLSFIYAVFDHPVRAAHYVFYRAEAREPEAGVRDRFIPFDAIPWAGLPDSAVRTMLQRYVNERRENTFGIYVGDHKSGTVRSVSQ